MNPARHVVFTLGLSVLIITISVAWLSSISAATWASWQPATCLQVEGCFCEADQSTESVRQPANAWSSFAYVVVGSWILVGAAVATAGGPYQPLIGAAVGVNAVIIGVGSAFYHASLTFTGQFFDILGMYLLAVLMLVYALQRVLGWSLTRAVGVYVALSVALAIVQVAWPDTRRYLFALVLLVALGVELIYRRRAAPKIQTLWFHLGLGLFALAFLVWILDTTGVLCAPNSLVQGHALWHLLGAAAVACLHLYYRSETRHD